LNEAFGSEADLKDLISQAKAKDMGIMVDVVSTDHTREERDLLRTQWLIRIASMEEQVVNHVAATASGNFIPNDSYGPFNSTAQYHPFCWVDGEPDKIAFSTCRVNLLV
jgi:hypothetical protein